VNIYSNDGPLPMVTVLASTANAAEPATHGSFRLYRTGDLTNALSVTVTLGGTATILSDYRVGASLNGSLTRTITIPATRDWVGVQIAVLDDSEVEAPETVTMTVATGLGYEVGSPSTATVTISSDDLAA